MVFSDAFDALLEGEVIKRVGGDLKYKLVTEDCEEAEGGIVLLLGIVGEDGNITAYTNFDINDLAARDWEIVK